MAYGIITLIIVYSINSNSHIAWPIFGGGAFDKIFSIAKTFRCYYYIYAS